MTSIDLKYIESKILMDEPFYDVFNTLHTYYPNLRPACQGFNLSVWW